MKDMVALMRLDIMKPTDEDFLSENHLEVNAAGLPCVHVAAHMGRTEVVKRLLLQKPGLPMKGSVRIKRQSSIVQ